MTEAQWKASVLDLERESCKPCPYWSDHYAVPEDTASEWKQRNRFYGNETSRPRHHLTYWQRKRKAAIA